MDGMAMAGRLNVDGRSVSALGYEWRCFGASPLGAGIHMSTTCVSW